MKVKATKWIAENADALGAHSIWIGEDIGIGQDVFILSASTLRMTERCRVGTAIVPVSTHNIATLARAALSLCDIGRGRFVFGTGIGGIQDLQRLGIAIKRPVTALRETVLALRNIWKGKTVSAECEVFKLNGFGLHIDAVKDIPVFLGVRGPQMLRLVGQIADGAILSGPLDYLKYATNEIDSSARIAGRDPEDIEKIAWLPTIPTFKGGKESLAKRVVAIVVADMPEKILGMLSVDEGRIHRLRDAVARKGPDAGVPFVNDEMMDMFAITGDLLHMVDMFEKVAALGITEVVLGPPFTGDWRGAVQDIFKEIRLRRE